MVAESGVGGEERVWCDQPPDPDLPLERGGQQKSPARDARGGARYLFRGDHAGTVMAAMESEKLQSDAG